MKGASQVKAAVLTDVRRLEILDVAIDTPGPREVRIRTAAAGICGSDYNIYSGKHARPMPLAMGHESAGVVEAVGGEVRAVAPGDHVVTCVSGFCGACEFCLSGRPALCARTGLAREPHEPPRLSVDGVPLTQMSGLSSWSESLLVHENNVVKVAPSIPLDRAALMACGVVTGLGSTFRSAQVQPGSTVAVIGCGGVGLNVVQGARIAGATQIIAIDSDASKLTLARTLGATHTIDVSEVDDAVAEVVELTDGGVEFSFEVIGLPQTAVQAFLMLRLGGLATLVGVQRGATLELPGGHFGGERKIQGSAMGSNRFRLDIPRYVDLYNDGRLKLDELITARISLDELPGTLARYGEPGEVRSVITF